MRLYIGIFSIALIIALVEVLFYIVFLRKTKHPKRWMIVSFSFSAFYVAYWAILFITSPESYEHLQPDNYSLYFLATTIMILFYFPRIIALLIQLILFILSLTTIWTKQIAEKTSLLLGGAIMILILAGIFVLRFQFRVIEVPVKHAAIPESFEGYRIVQISDLHLGTAKYSKGAFNRMVNKINALEPDMVVFTGDLVNNFASELDGWEPILNKIESNDGVYAILGNHDYGDYVKWRTPKDKEQNFAEIVSFFDKINWQLMRNERKILVIINDTLLLAGVENWGHPPFPQYGELNKSVPLSTRHPVILLSHDPSHWESEILKHQANIFLTLSGHTHGLQFGIRSSWLNISPVSMKYEKWGGLYEHDSRLLYINVGTGTIGFPGRIGMRPEITLLTLHSKN
jgi:predicted MPP superfamily phosphohydrolase